MTYIPINETPETVTRNGIVVSGDISCINIYKVVEELYKREDAPCYQPVEKKILYKSIKCGDPLYEKALIALLTIQSLEESI